jgi:hypothetical protein
MCVMVCSWSLVTCSGGDKGGDAVVVLDLRCERL